MLIYAENGQQSTEIGLNPSKGHVNTLVSTSESKSGWNPQVQFINIVLKQVCITKIYARDNNFSQVNFYFKFAGVEKHKLKFLIIKKIRYIFTSTNKYDDIFTLINHKYSPDMILNQIEVLALSDMVPFAR